MALRRARLWLTFEECAEDRKLLPADPSRDEACDEGNYCHSEERAAVAFNFDPNLGEVGPNSPDHQAQRHGRSNGSRAWNEQENHGNELDDSQSDAAKRFDTKLSEKRNGFRCCSELEEQSLGENDGGDDLGGPGDSDGVFHGSSGGWSHLRRCRESVTGPDGKIPKQHAA